MGAHRGASGNLPEETYEAYVKAKKEYKQFFRLGVDGMFSDFADTGLAARDEYMKELGR